MRKFLINNSYSFELNNVIGYAEDVLTSEFHTSTITVQYLMLALMDVKNCHASMILSNCLTKQHIDNIRNAYASVLSEESDGRISSDRPTYSPRLEELLKKHAPSEQARTNANELCSEHILLAVLNEDNKYSEGDILRKFGLEYPFILERCVQRIQKNNNFTMDIPPKVKAETGQKNQFLSLFTESLNRKYQEGRLDDVFERDDKIEEVIKVLSRRKKNNVVIVGNGGCGKTSIVNGLAALIEKGDVPPTLEGKEILVLNSSKLIGGTGLRGMFEERISGLFTELKAKNKYILFIDDIQNILKSSMKEKDSDMSGVLGDILDDGNVKIIAACNFKDYKNTIEINSSLSRKFQKVVVEANTIKETISILTNIKEKYENYHNVRYSPEIIKKTVELANRYITTRELPDSAIDVMDLAGASVAVKSCEDEPIKELKNRLREIQKMKEEALNRGDFEFVNSVSGEENIITSDLASFRRRQSVVGHTVTDITIDDILSSISDISGIPVSKMNVDEMERISNIDKVLKKSVVGQDEAVDFICKVVKRNKVGLGDKTKTLGNILCCGPSGVGKTLIAKKLAEEVFGDPKALVRIDMSEYSEKNSVSKLTGAAPGYIGFDTGGQLTEAIKNKQHCVLLLDEIEKADQEVYNIFLQLFDDGRLTDSSGQIVNFKNVIVLMTSNIGAKAVSEMGEGLGFVENQKENKKTIIERELKKKFTPEFLNRLDKIVFFNDLTDENMAEIARIEVDKLSNRVNEIGHGMSYSDDVLKLCVRKSKEANGIGARPLLRVIQDNIEDKITDIILENKIEDDHVFSISVENDAFKIE